MNKKSKIGIIIVLVIAVAVWWPLLLAAWIYLVWMVRKKRISLFSDQMEPKLAERRYKMLKAFLLVAGISFAMIWVSILVGVDIFHLPEKDMEYIVEYIAFSFLGLFNLATIVGLVIFLTGRLKTTPAA